MAMTWLFSELVGYLLVALVISTILKPLVNTLRYLSFFKYRLPQAIAVLLALGALLVVIVGSGLLFVPLIVDQISRLASLDLNEITHSLEEPIKQIEGFLIDAHIVRERSGFLRKQIRVYSLTGSEKLYFNTLVTYVITVFKNVTISVLAITFLTYFLLYERGILKRTFLRFVPNSYFELTLGAMFKIEKVLTGYLIGLLIQLTGIFTMTSIALLVLGVDYALTIALFAAIINLVPYLGPLIGGVFSVLVVISTSPVLPNPEAYLILALKVVVISSLIHLIDNLVMQPYIFSRSVKAHPMEIFVAIFAGAALGGILGMILAIPVYTVIRVIYRELNQGYERYRVFRSSSHLSKATFSKNSFI